MTSLDINTGETFQYTSDIRKPGGLIDDYITSYYIDGQNIIWLGTRKGNIYMANTNRYPFKLYHNYIQKNHKPFPTSVRVILKDDEDLWLGTNHNGVFILKGSEKNKEHSFFASNYDQTQPRSMFKDKKGDFWLGSTSGLQCFKSESERLVDVINRKTHPGLEIWSVFSIAESSKNRIWLGLYNALGKIELKNKRVSVLNLSEVIDGHSVMQVMEDREGNVWLATEGNGVVCLKYDPYEICVDTLLYNTNTEPRLCGNLVYSLFEDQHNQIWAGTSLGLSCINSKRNTIRNFRKEDGLPEDYISAVTGDAAGNIWVSHKMGVSKIETGQFKIQNFNIRGNNENWVFLDGACFNDTSNNQIYFGARNGFISFSPDSIKNRTTAPDFLLSSLNIAGKEVEPGDTVNGKILLHKALFKTESISLKHDQNSFSIEMDAIYFPNMMGVRYLYYLEGYEDDWRESKSKKVTFAKVPPGDYIFKAKAVSPEGNWSEVKKIAVRIIPPWYATIWAYISYIAFVFVILLLIYRIIISRERLKNQIQVERLKSEKQEELNKAKIEFYTNVSHEFRTPLTLISDPLKQLMNVSKMDEKKSELYLSIIHRNVWHLSHLISQLLDFRKAEVGKMTANLEVCDIHEVVKSVLLSFEPMIVNRKMELRFSGLEGSLYGYFDKDKIKQILENLLSNAFKYTPDKGIVEVQVKKEDNARRLIILVKDSGVGIAQDKLSKVFEPFIQISTKPFYGTSSGIGLAYTKKLVEVLNGEISINSIPQKGTEIFLSLPFEIILNNEFDEIRNGNVDSGKYSAGSREEQKPVVLIVEDSRDIQVYLESELIDSYEIITESDGLNGFKTAVSKVPDIIISDIMMPKMNGNKLCHKIKTHEQTCHIPVILLTAKSTEANKVEGLKNGADVYISKPFSVEVLKAQVESILENRLRMQRALEGKEHTADLVESESQIKDKFLMKAIAAIEKNIEIEGFNAQQLATILQISQRQLYRKLRAVSGSTAHEFIVRVRMDKAAELLLNTNLNISEVAFKVGFSEPSNFTRTFSRHFGYSPSKYVEIH